jgi:hypothetical protein
MPDHKLKRVFIIHGWDGNPEEGWFPWLKRELELLGFEVCIPQMPNAAEPRIVPWVKALEEVVGDLDNQTYFIGHSMGCQAIVRYLAGNQSSVVIGGAVFVAGFFTRLTNIENNDLEKSVVKEWLETSLDFDRVRSHLKSSWAVFSDNDPFVPLDNQKAFVNELGSSVLVEHDRQHFSGQTSTFDLPIVKDLLVKLAGR